MKAAEVVYLGPEGTYAHQVAEKRFGRRARLVPQPSIIEAFSYAAASPRRRLVVPIENSSAGTVYETVDILLSGKYDLRIEEGIDIHVRLALLGHKGHKPRVLYSHFAPLVHCDSWIRAHLRGVERREVPSTGVAAREAAQQSDAVAIGSRRAARTHGLDVLSCPIAQDVPNVTQFFVLARNSRPLPRASRISLGVNLANRPGSLCSFLEPFRDNRVNLSRLVSRPIPGRPSEYAFFVDVEGSLQKRAVIAAMEQASRTGAIMHVMGSYPVRTYHIG